MAHPLSSVAYSAYFPAAFWGLSQGAILPVIALSAIDRGADVALAAAVSSMIGIGSLITNIPSGILAARIGERRAMLIAAGMMLAGITMCLLPIAADQGGLIVLSCALLLVGASGAVFNLARQAYLAEAVPPEFRARAFSMLGGVHRVGVLIGPFASAGAIQLWGLSGAFWVSIVAISIATIVIARIPDLPAAPEVRRAAADVTTRTVVVEHWRTFVTLGVGVSLLCAVRQTRMVVIPLWAAQLGLSPTTSALILGIAGAIDVLLFYPAGRVMDRHGRHWITVPSALVLALAFLILPWSSDTATLAMVAVVMGVGNGIGAGIVMTLGADSSPSVGRHAFLGVWRELADIGSGAGPLVLAAATMVVGLAGGALVVGGLGLAAAAAFWRWTPRPVARPAASRA